MGPLLTALMSARKPRSKDNQRRKWEVAQALLGARNRNPAGPVRGRVMARAPLDSKGVGLF